MKVAVTGGCGFIGHPLLGALVGLGDSVVAIDNGWRGRSEPPRGVERLDADVRDPEALLGAFAGADVAVHLAAIQGTANFYRQPELVLDVNLRGVLNAADACARTGVRRLVFSSSSEVYGLPNAFPTSESEQLVVPDPLNPRWSYGGSKIAGELVVANWARHHGFEFTILRYHNVYGPAMGWDHVIPQFIRRLTLEEDFTVQGSGEQRRAFCYLDDAVAATVEAIHNPRAAGEILNIGNAAEEVSINELIERLARISGKSIEARYEPFEGAGTSRRLPDVSRARQVLGWEASTPLDEGLRRTYDWCAAALRKEGEPQLR